MKANLYTNERIRCSRGEYNKVALCCHLMSIKANQRLTQSNRFVCHHFVFLIEAVFCVFIRCVVVVGEGWAVRVGKCAKVVDRLLNGCGSGFEPGSFVSIDLYTYLLTATVLYINI